MRHEQVAEQLSDYLDGELTDTDQRTVANHLAECDVCRTTLQELEAVVATARRLPASEPSADVWRGIEAQIHATPGTRPLFVGRGGVSVSWPQLAAAAVVLATVSGWAAVRVLSPAVNPVSASATPAVNDATLADAAVDDDRAVRASFDAAEYDAAVADLKTALEKGRGALDPATVQLIEDNLSTISRAVDEARQALKDDPANGFLSGYLVNTQRRQLDLLRHTAALVSTAD